MSNITKPKIIKTLEEQTISLNTEVNRIQIKKALLEEEITARKEKCDAFINSKNLEIRRLKKNEWELGLEVKKAKEKRDETLIENKDVDEYYSSKNKELSEIKVEIEISKTILNNSKKTNEDFLQRTEEAQKKHSLAISELNEKEKLVKDLILKNEEIAKNNKDDLVRNENIKKLFNEKDIDIHKRNQYLVNTENVLNDRIKAIEVEEKKLADNIETYEKNVLKVYSDKEKLEKDKMDLVIREDNLVKAEKKLEEDNSNLSLRERNFNLTKIEVESKEKELTIMAKKYNADNLK